MEQSFVTRRFIAAVILLASLNLLRSPPSGSVVGLAGGVLGAVAGAAMLVSIVKALYLGARRLVTAVGSDA